MFLKPLDPPYNTGKDFVYADNFAKDKKAYWEETGATEEGVALGRRSEGHEKLQP